MSDDVQPLTLRDLLRIAARRRIAAGVACAAVILIGLYLAARAPTLYIATARLALERGKQAAGIAPEPGRETLEEQELTTHRELLQTRDVARRAIAAGGLMVGPAYAAASDPDGLLASRLSVNLVRGAWVLVVTLADEDPRRAESGLSAVIDAYRAALGERNRARAMGNATFIERELAETERRLAKALDAERAYRVEHGVVDDVADTSHHAHVLDALVRERVELTSRASAAAALDREVVAGNALTDPAARRAALITIPRIALEDLVVRARARLLELEGRQAELARKFGPKHPTMIELAGELDGYRGQLDGAIDAVVRTLAVENRLAAERLAQQDTRVAEHERRLADYRQHVARARALQADREAIDKLRGELVDRLARERIAAGDQARPLAVADPPAAAGRASSGDRVRTLLVALVLAVGAGLLAAVAAEVLDRRVRTAEDAVSIAGLPLVARLPTARHGLPADPRQPAEAGYDEAVRGLRAALRRSGVGDQGHAVLLIAGCTAGDGARSVAVRLAVSFASAGVRTLLIEGDLRRPHCAEVLGIAGEPGFAALLAGVPAVSPAAALPNLDVMPAGNQPGNPAELLNSHCLPEWLAQCRESYGIVVMVAPALAEFADAVEAAASCDDVVVVVRAGATARTALATAASRLMPLRAKVLGLVVNAA